MKEISYHCGSCFHWEEMPEQPKDVPDGKTAGFCRGAPPQMLMTAVPVNTTKSGVVVAVNERQQHQIAMMPVKHLPPMLNDEPGCSRHQEAAMQTALYVQQRIMEMAAAETLRAIPPQGNA